MKFKKNDVIILKDIDESVVSVDKRGFVRIKNAYIIKDVWEKQEAYIIKVVGKRINIRMEANRTDSLYQRVGSV